jgi:predicted secreted protein
MLKAYDQAEVIEEKVGEEFDIGPFRAVVDAGYSWDAIALSCAHLLRRERIPVSDQPGSPVDQMFTFKAAKPGKHYLEFIYWRRWETQILDKKVYTLILT